MRLKIIVPTMTALLIMTGCVEKDALNSSLYDVNCTEIPVREASKKYIAMLKTGQTKSYDILKLDDGKYQKGAERSFSRDNASKTVTDDVTGLMWQDDKNVTKTWEGAINYCADLNISGYDDWRLPDTMELSTIVNFGKIDLGNEPEFENFFDNYHWSSTTYTQECSKAWLQSFEWRYTHTIDKITTLNVRCVRGGDENLSGGFFRDDLNKIVEHNTTGLMWQDDDNITRNWEDAITYCEELDLGDYVDWRLPNRNEMTSIIDYSKYNPTIDTKFQNNVADDYWTSTTRADKTDNNTTLLSAFTGRFVDGEVDSVLKTKTVSVRCVRSD